MELASADVALCAVRGREIVLRRALEPARQHYDLVVVDCPPSFSLLSVNGIVAADGILVPVSPDPLTIDALDSLLGAIERVRARMRTKARVLGLVVNAADAQRKPGRDIIGRLRAEFRDRVFETDVPWTPALSAAAGARQTIFQAAPKSIAAESFRRLAGEMLQQLPGVRRHD